MNGLKTFRDVSGGPRRIAPFFRLPVVPRAGVELTVHSPVSGEHDVGRDQEPERVVAHKRNINKHGNNGETCDDERNDVYAEDVEHRRCPYAPRNPRLIQLRLRPWTNTTTSLDRLHPTLRAEPTGPSDSGVFAVSKRLVRLRTQSAGIMTLGFTHRQAALHSVRMYSLRHAGCTHDVALERPGSKNGLLRALRQSIPKLDETVR
jgi:hypothetical protein